MIPLDTTDRQLVEALQKDGRASYADLSEMVGLSPAATRLRVQRLLDAGQVDRPAAVIFEPVRDRRHAVHLFQFLGDLVKRDILVLGDGKLLVSGDFTAFNVASLASFCWRMVTL